MRPKDFAKVCEITGERNFHGRVLHILEGKPFLGYQPDKKTKEEQLRKEIEFIGKAIKVYHLVNKNVKSGNYLDDGKLIFENYERVRKSLPAKIRNDWFLEREAQYMSDLRKVLVDVRYGKEVEESKRTELISLVRNMEKSAESDLSKLKYESKKNSFPFSKREENFANTIL